MDKDEYYRDILEGLAVYFDSEMVADIARTVKYQQPDHFGNAWNRKQIRGKQWLVNEVVNTLTGRFEEILVLGGWYGILSALFLNDKRIHLKKATNLDIDPSCEEIAKQVNYSSVKKGKFETVSADMLSFSYEKLVHDKCLVINTSCEHIQDFNRWLDLIPNNTLLTLQSNNYYSVLEHVNCVPDLETFKQQAPLSEIYFADQLELKNYTRFMLIGRK